MPVSINGNTGITFPDGSLQTAAASPLVLRNRIINGDMRIDQRNNGASVTPTSGQYTLDRWKFDLTQTSKLTTQQNAGAVTPPVGFSNYLGITSSSAYSVLAGDYFLLSQTIEGFNFADMAWGTANAKTITLSFQVYSSLTGTFGGAINNSAQNRSYPFTYSIPVANTWTTISVTIAGDTTGTWIGATNGAGLRVYWNLGTGTTFSGTAGAWAGATYLSATGATSVVGTNGATFYITGVQLEQNTSATPFERRLYNQELANCQRYYWKWQGNKFLVTARETNSWWGNFIHPVTMRTTPTISSNFTTFAATGPSATGQLSVYGNGWKTSSGSPAVLLDGADIWDAQPYVTGFAGTYSDSASIISAGYTYIDFSAEL
jgi:hypothetical protein